MIIRHSLLLLEQLAEVEEKIRSIEEAINNLGVEVEKEKLIELLLARRLSSSSDQ